MTIHFPSIQFEKSAGDLLYYTSFVSSLDGKVAVQKDGYWPIGSMHDYNFFTYLRSRADVIIDGKQTAIAFGNRTIDTIHKAEFNTMRKKVGKKEKVHYIIITSHPDSKLAQALTNKYLYKPFVFTTKEAVVCEELLHVATIVRFPSIDKNIVDLTAVHEFFQKKKYEYIFIDGGSVLLGTFLRANLLDELFLTVAPKIIGNEQGKTSTMVEGMLFPPDAIKQVELISSHHIDSEVFLRYKIKKGK